MRKLALIAALAAMLPTVIPAVAQDSHNQTAHKTTAHKKSTHKKKHYRPKNEISKLRQDRKESHPVRQMTPDPKKSPGKHADNLSKNVNHEVNRESKSINHLFQGKHKKDSSDNKDKK